jgi:predicted RNase H-like nuclease (RuvC/YqgF family)
MEQQVDTLPDETRGIMHRIREHLIEGKSSQEVITLGYAPGSVYKIQRQLRRSSGEKEEASVRATPEAQVPIVDTEAGARMERLETENIELRTQIVELAKEIEKVASLHSRLDQLQRRFEKLDTEVIQSQQIISRYARRQQRIETLERQVQRLDEVVCFLSLLVYHLDVHHRQLTHGWSPDPADQDLQPTDQGYRTLQQRLRQWLSEAMTDFKQRQQFGLPVRFKNLANL